MPLIFWSTRMQPLLRSMMKFSNYRQILHTESKLTFFSYTELVKSFILGSWIDENSVKSWCYLLVDELINNLSTTAQHVFLYAYKLQSFAPCCKWLLFEINLLIWKLDLNFLFSWLDNRNILVLCDCVFIPESDESGESHMLRSSSET